MTECTELRLAFATEGRREIVAEFNGGQISSDAGALLLRETDQKLNLLPRLSQCFLDGRDPDLIEHSVQQMLAQRVYALALGYEDLNDHDQLRNDPLLQVLAGKAEPGEEALASKSTLNRLELGDGRPNRYKKIAFWRDAIDDLLLDLFLEAYQSRPARLCWISTPRISRFMVSRKGVFTTASMIITAICRCTCLPASMCCAHACGRATSILQQEAAKRSSAS